MPIQIRPMQPQETTEARRIILSIAARIFQPDATEAFIAEHGHTLEDVDHYQRDYSPPDGLFLVALDGDRLIGTGAMRRLDDETAELRRMWLLEPYQGRGIGYRLAHQLLAFARGAGYKRIRLTTNEENERAILFYKRLGFFRIEAYHQANDDICMEYRIDAENND